jgi:hypothetical protein
MTEKYQIRIYLFNKIGMIFNITFCFVIVLPFATHVSNVLLNDQGEVGFYYKLIYLPIFIWLFFISQRGGILTPGFISLFLLQKGDIVKVVNGITSMNLETLSFTMEYSFGKIISKRSEPLSFRRAIDCFLNMFVGSCNNSRYRHYAMLSMGGTQKEVPICDIDVIVKDYNENLLYYSRSEKSDLL